MAFIGQVNLAEASSVAPDLRLPKAGLLSFFLGCSDQAYDKGDDSRLRYMTEAMAGTDEAYYGAWRVLFYPYIDDVERVTYTSTPLPELFDPCAIDFARGGLSLPDELTVAYDELSLDVDERDSYNELIESMKPDESVSAHQLMGYPNLIQSTPPEMMCELASRGMNPWHYPKTSDPAYAELAAAACDWGLILQLTSCSDTGFMWGDAGHFYFYGDRRCVERGDFSKTWVGFEN